MVGDGNRRGYRHLLDAFWDQARSFGIPLPTSSPVSAAAFCQARAKLDHEFVRALLHDVVERFETSFPEDSVWHGRRVLAVDGTRLNVQRSPDLDRAFGRQSQGHCPQALASVLFNVASKMPMDVVVESFATSERELLLREHLPLLNAGDIDPAPVWWTRG